MTPFDTIVAPITGTQRAAVAVIRISGPDAWETAGQVFEQWPAHPESHRAIYGRYTTGDEGLALPFAEGHSYTGDQAVELSCHGSPASVRALVQACIKAGARPAGPGEFTERAFLNGRIDLTEAEAVADTVNALTDAQLKLANRQREGSLHREVSRIRQTLLKLLGAVEASVDFEEEIGPLDRAQVARDLSRVLEVLRELLSKAEIGQILRRGLRIAIVGPPNAGKSSLFNAILGHERAIVTPAPGTTRDTIEELVDVGGVPVVFIDTAGVRQTDDLAESLGVQRSLAQIAQSDLVWLVFDASLPIGKAEVFDIFPNAVRIANKIDLAKDKSFDLANFAVSAKTGEGLDGLLASIAKYSEAAADLQVPPIDTRHVPLLDSAADSLSRAVDALENGLPDDLLSTLLVSAANQLGEVTGETASPDMIERIFADFCIGK